MKARYIAASALMGALASTTALADSDGQWSNGYDHMMSGAGYGLLGGLMMLAFWGGAIALVVVGVRMFSGQQESQSKPKALEILRERFAKGELDEDEFSRRKAALDA